MADGFDQVGFDGAEESVEASGAITEPLFVFFGAFLRLIYFGAHVREEDDVAD